VEPDKPPLGVFAVVGYEYQTGKNLDGLFGGVVAALEKGESIRVGFYDWGYPQSATFWPRKLEDGDNCKDLRFTKVFTGGIGSASPHLLGCMTISQQGDDVDAVLVIAPTSSGGLASGSAGS